MLLDDGLGFHKDPYNNPLRQNARTYYHHRAGDQKLIDQDIAELETQLRKEAKELVKSGKMLAQEVESNIGRALSIVRGAVNTERYWHDQMFYRSPDPRAVGQPASPARAKRRQEWREELDEEEDGQERNNEVTPPRMTRAQARAATPNSDLMEETEMAKSKTVKAKGNGDSAKPVKKEVKLAAGYISRADASKRLSISGGRVRALFTEGVLKGKSPDELLETSVEARKANVRNIGRRFVLGLGGVGPKDKPAKAARASAKNGKTAKAASGKTSGKKNSDVASSRAVPKPVRTKKAKKEKGADLPTFENGKVDDQTPVYAPVED